MDNKTPKIVLIKPYVPPDKFGTVSPWDVPDLGLSYLAAVLEKFGKNVSIIDCFIKKQHPDDLIKELKEIKPDIIGITGNVYSAKYSCFTAFKIQKSIDSIVVMGGPYATTEYEYLLKKNLTDIVVLGEGEYTFLDLINTIESNGDLGNVKGISFRNKPKLSRWIKSPLNTNDNFHEVIKTAARPLIDNLDELPFPAWHLFPHPKNYKNLRGVVRRPYLPIITTRGCSFSCIWCNKNIHGYKIRERSIENVIEEMKFFHNKYGIKEFAIMDDDFAFSEKRVFKFCYLLTKANLDLSINLYPGVRADKLTWNMINALRSHGVNRITVGVESGNQQVVKKIGKNLDLNKVREAVKMTKKAGLVADGFFMLGLPFDNEKTMDETINFAKELDFHHAYFFMTTPFPGTPLYELVKRKGKFIEKYFLGIPNHIVEGKPVYIMGELDEKILAAKFKEAWIGYYFRIKKILQLIKVYGIYLLKYRSVSEIKWLISQFLFFVTKLNLKKSRLVRN